jgi:recombination protein RecA
MSDKSDSLKNRIDDIIKVVRKNFGDEILFSSSDKSVTNVPVISTGLMSLDIALGIGGIPRGRIIEVFGPEGQGKTTMALHMIAEAQKAGDIAAFIDVEHALDIKYAGNIGVDVDKLLISQPDYGEQALDLVSTLIKTNEVGIIVIDSVAALVPKEEIENSVDKATIALQARMMSKHLRSITSLLGKKSSTCVLFINQVREKIGVMWGNPEDTPGGRALKFYSSVRIDVRKKGQSKRVIKTGDEILAIRCHCKVIKNKLASPFRDTAFEIVFGKGIDVALDLISIGLNKKIITKTGSFYLYKDKKFHGESQLIKYFDSDVRMNNLKRKILSKVEE